MKKTLAVLLAAIMLFACLPMAFADEINVITDINFDTDYTFSASDALKSGFDYTVNEGVTVTVPAGVTLYIPENGSLTVNGVMVVEGSVVVQPTAALTVKGSIQGAAKVSGAGTAEVEVRFPSLSKSGWASSDLDVYYAYSVSGNASENLTEGFTYTKIPATGLTAYVPLNTYLYVKTDIVRGGHDVSDKKFDDDLVWVTFNNAPTTNKATQIHAIQVLTAGDIAYAPWTNENDYLKTYKIALTSGKGYAAVGQDGEYETAYIKYGQPFTFRIEFDEDYSMAKETAEVYIYNGYGVVSYDGRTPQEGVKPTYPDASGNYLIPKVQDNYTVYVSMLPMDNQTTEKVGGILQTIRSVFQMIINFFRQIGNIFKIGG